jgi:hypothetical protein
MVHCKNGRCRARTAKDRVCKLCRQVKKNSLYCYIHENKADRPFGSVGSKRSSPAKRSHPESNEIRKASDLLKKIPSPLHKRRTSSALRSGEAKFKHNSPVARKRRSSSLLRSALRKSVGLKHVSPRVRRDLILSIGSAKRKLKHASPNKRISYEVISSVSPRRPKSKKNLKWPEVLPRRKRNSSPSPEHWHSIVPVATGKVWKRPAQPTGAPMPLLEELELMMLKPTVTREKQNRILRHADTFQVHNIGKGHKAVRHVELRNARDIRNLSDFKDQLNLVSLRHISPKYK